MDGAEPIDRIGRIDRSDSLDATAVLDGIDELAVLRAVGERFPYALAMMGPDLGIEWATPNIADVLGYAAGDFVGRNATELIHPEDLERIIPLVLDVLSEAESTITNPAAATRIELDARALAADGRWVPVAVCGRVFDTSGRLLVVIRSSPERFALDEVVHQLSGHAPLDDVLRSLLGLLRAQFRLERAWMIHDTEGEAVSVGSGALPELGSDELLGAHRDGDRPDPAVRFDDRWWRVPVMSTDGSRLLGLFVFPAPRVGGPNPYDHDVLGRTIHLATLAFTRAEDDRLLRRAATHDHLTGVLSRREFETQLDRLASSDDHLPAVVLFVDLDHFKRVNDEHGHHAGDHILVTVARRLESSVRPQDAVGRLGGDEFAVLCRGLRPGLLPDVLVRLNTAIRQPIEIDGSLIAISASVGAAVAESRRELPRLLRNADAEMYRVKSERNGRAPGGA